MRFTWFLCLSGGQRRLTAGGRGRPGCHHTQNPNLRWTCACRCACKVGLLWWRLCRALLTYRQNPTKADPWIETVNNNPQEHNNAIYNEYIRDLGRAGAGRAR